MPLIFRPLCLGHDPALPIDPASATSPGWPDLPDLLAELRAAQQYPLAAHRDCDVLIGGYREDPGLAPELLSIICPPHPIDSNPGDHQHQDFTLIEPVWLELMAAVIRPDTGRYLPPSGDPLTDALRQIPACWSTTRVRRLTNLLRE